MGHERRGDRYVLELLITIYDSPENASIPIHSEAFSSGGRLCPGVRLFLWGWGLGKSNVNI